MNTEEWRPVVGGEGAYEVSDLGRVRSIDRLVPVGNHMRRHPGRLLSQRLNRKGYPVVGLVIGGREINTRVHILVCEAWHGMRPEGMVCRHLDGNPTNNSPDNLTWGTHAENCQDAVRHGTHNRASRTQCRRGHEYTPENTVVTSRGYRECLACNEDYKVLRAARAIAARAAA